MITNDGGWGYGPRSIMAQKKDGSIMFFVIDGRQTHSIGASLRDCQDILYEKGAVNAMAMDGASSATLYAMGDILNIPSTLSHKSRYLPNAWVVTHAHQLKRTNKMKFLQKGYKLFNRLILLKNPHAK